MPVLFYCHTRQQNLVLIWHYPIINLSPFKCLTLGNKELSITVNNRLSGMRFEFFFSKSSG
ncbi:hypothetical protein BpHYR1_042716 [Brachionus plicatilis]|uniref:Uncharacterized protein n=1 Tax=Brachionus plicatilis TaxID=10195 RepID=A0A3M7PVP7_BRAPC|nr:hypothetical protein BpHYR1_042716 [Brachionus plicatilis]